MAEAGTFGFKPEVPATANHIRAIFMPVGLGPGLRPGYRLRLLAMESISSEVVMALEFIS